MSNVFLVKDEMDATGLEFELPEFEDDLDETLGFLSDEEDDLDDEDEELEDMSPLYTQDASHVGELVMV